MCATTTENVRQNNVRVAIDSMKITAGLLADESSTQMRYLADRADSGARYGDIFTVSTVVHTPAKM